MEAQIFIGRRVDQNKENDQRMATYKSCLAESWQKRLNENEKKRRKSSNKKWNWKKEEKWNVRWLRTLSPSAFNP